MAAQIRVYTDANSAIHVYNENGTEITGIESVNIDCDLATGKTYIAIVLERDIDRDIAGSLLDAPE